MFFKIFLLFFFFTFNAFAQTSFAPIVEKVMPSVVNVSTKEAVTVDNPEIENDLLFDNSDGHVFLGSGFVADKEGYILTNRHVIEKAKEILVTTFDGKTYPAELKGEDKITDIALIKINVDSDLSFADFADSDEIKVGDWIIAVGNPFGLSNSVTTGIVSAKSRNINESVFDDYIQTDAPINPGNSGGPMFNLSGQVVGLNTLIFSKQGNALGVGFAIPSNQIKWIYQSLKEKGKVERSTIGVQFKQNGSFLTVTEITNEKLAQKNGFEIGDVIVSCNNKPVHSLSFLQNIIATLEDGEELTIKVNRNSQELELLVEAEVIKNEKMETIVKKSDINGIFYPSIGLTLDHQKITNVASQSEAEEKGIKEGDEIVTVNGHEILNVHDFELELKEYAANKRPLHIELKDMSGMPYFVNLTSSKN